MFNNAVFTAFQSCYRMNVVSKIKRLMAFIRLLFRHDSDRTKEGYENLRIICVLFEIRTSKQSSDVDGVSPCGVFNDGFVFGLLFNPKIEAMCTSKRLITSCEAHSVIP